MKSITGKVKSTVIPDLHCQDPSATDTKSKAELLNSFFAGQPVLPGSETAIPDVSSVAIHP